MMKRKRLVLLFSIATLASIVFIGGCNEKFRSAPHIRFSNFSIRAELTRDDIEVLNRVAGTCSTKNIFFGVIQIVDDKDLKLFWSADTDERAYYRALNAAPDADAVFYKSMYSEWDGIPPIVWVNTVTYTGKAIKLKTD
jgi:hypothetical protein